MAEKLRIYADFNSGGWPGVACWCLRHGSEFCHLDELEQELGLSDGQAVTLYYEDEAEEFEVDGVLEVHPEIPKWRAVPDWSTFRRLRG